MERDIARLLGGLLLAVVAAVLLVTTDLTIAAPITLLIVGIVLIATSRPSDSGGHRPGFPL